ncbi:hypothetical protein ACU686_39670 [Yinghuangia aomiensis]
MPDTPKSGIFDPEKLAQTTMQQPIPKRIINISTDHQLPRTRRRPFGTPSTAASYRRRSGEHQRERSRTGLPGRIPRRVSGVGAGPRRQNMVGQQPRPWVSIAAPGTRIASACTEPTRYCSRTAHPTQQPHLRGEAARLVRASRLDRNQVIKRLTDTACKADGEIVPNDQVGYGIS